MSADSDIGIHGPVAHPKSPQESRRESDVSVLPELLVLTADLPATARALRDLLAKSGRIFERGVPVKVTKAAGQDLASATELTVNNVVIEAHRLCRPTRFTEKGGHVPVTLPERVARLYLDMGGEWNLSPLAGITTSPLLSADSAVRTAEGYDVHTGTWCSRVPDLRLPSRPTHDDATAALLVLRETFHTFPFSDAPRVFDAGRGIEVTDLGQPPGLDESAFLAGLMTAACRASLDLAPGLVLTAPPISGSGSGKGMLVRAICSIAFGIRPRSFTAGKERQELDKRLAAELVEASPVLFLDNVNGTTLRSDTLASVLTERPARVRVLGQTRMALLNSTAFIAVTGNGLVISEDLVRRFLICELDARCEDPEARPFQPGFLEAIDRRRPELLAALLTIWRFGRQNVAGLLQGRPLGSFETWASWVRDPLITLGCADPVARISTAKANDPQRRLVAELFDVWWLNHREEPVTAAQLADPVRAVADPQGRGRQFLTYRLAKLVGTRVGGFVLTCHDPIGRWSARTFALRQHPTDPSDNLGHRDHRRHKGDRMLGPGSGSVSPMLPMADAADRVALGPGGVEVI